MRYHLFLKCIRMIKLSILIWHQAEEYFECKILHVLVVDVLTSYRFRGAPPPKKKSRISKKTIKRVPSTNFHWYTQRSQLKRSRLDSEMVSSGDLGTLNVRSSQLKTFLRPRLQVWLIIIGTRIKQLLTLFSLLPIGHFNILQNTKIIYKLEY